MTKKFEIYKCNVCNNTVQVMFPGVGELVCCNEKMELLDIHEKDNTEIAEKHLPVVETDVNGRFIRVHNHPMENEHYIQMIEAYPTDKSALYVKYLRPKDVAEFDITALGHDFDLLGLCNIHGLWGNATKEGLND